MTTPHDLIADRSLALAVIDQLPIAARSDLATASLAMSRVSSPICAATIAECHDIKTAARANSLVLFRHLFRAAGPDRALVAAAKFGRVELIKFALLHGAKALNLGLCYACRSGSVEAVGVMINAGATNFDAAMESAGRGGNTAIIDDLVARDADLSGALMGACRSGNIDTAIYVLDRGVDTNDAMAMEIACRHGHAEICWLLVGRGAHMYNGIVRAAYCCGREEVIDVVDTFRAPTAALCGAYEGGHVALIAQLTADIPHWDPHPAFIAACRGGHLQLAAPLLPQIVNSPVIQETLAASIDAACVNGHLDVVRWLIDHNAPIQGLLTCACISRQQYMFDFASAVAKRDVRNAFRTACTVDCREFAERLLPEVDIVDDELVDIACTSGLIDIADKLMSGLHPRSTKQYIARWNAYLRGASDNGNRAAVELALSRGADALDGALIRACSRGRLEIAKFLVERGARNFDDAIKAADERGRERTMEWLMDKRDELCGRDARATRGADE